MHNINQDNNKVRKFGSTSFIPEGWFWLFQSKEIKLKQAKPISFMGLKLVIYRSEYGKIYALDAHCPHMGAHLCDGKVEGASIRCPFHYWRFDSNGYCDDIPCQEKKSFVTKLNSYRVNEAYGLIWLWTGSVQDEEDIPIIPELENKKLSYKLGKPFIKLCHPNVLMINAIDAQHFQSVHNLVVDLNMKDTVVSLRAIEFSNTTPLPEDNFLLRLVKPFYKKALTYKMHYWWGHTGSVTLGPDFLHFHIIFSLRPTLDGKAEGQTILVTTKGSMLKSIFVNPILLFLTKLVGNYFAKGDTIIFSRINFNLKTPLKSDKAIVSFINHYEKQRVGELFKKEYGNC